jgi:enamine deaminase RidA (YjgF/YER057c/UK114 family)
LLPSADNFHPCSQLAKVNAGSLLLIAGQVALDVTGNIVGKDDVRAQTERIFENLKAAIESTGRSFRNIIKLNVYMIDISRLADYREVRDRYVDVRNPPASTAIQVPCACPPRVSD